MGYYLGYGETHDLDLFTLIDVMNEGSAAVAETASEMGATLESIQTSPDFRRYLLTLESEAIVIDLIRERVAQIVADKPMVGIIKIDPPEEILANKLCALLGRAEIRDWWMFAPEISGDSVESALPAAASKDAGLTPGRLSCVQPRYLWKKSWSLWRNHGRGASSISQSVAPGFQDWLSRRNRTGIQEFMRPFLSQLFSQPSHRGLTTVNN